MRPGPARPPPFEAVHGQASDLGPALALTRHHHPGGDERGCETHVCVCGCAGLENSFYLVLFTK